MSGWNDNDLDDTWAASNSEEDSGSSSGDWDDIYDESGEDKEEKANREVCEPYYRGTLCPIL